MQNARLLLARAFQNGLCASFVRRRRGSSRIFIAAGVFSHTPTPVARPPRWRGSFRAKAAGSVLSVALLGLVVVCPNAFALPDELEVHLDDVTKTGGFAVDVITSYTISGPRNTSDPELRPTRHLIQVSPDFSYGVSKNTQVDLQLFSSVGLSGEARADGARVEVLTIPVRPADDDDDGPFLGALFEVGHLPATLSTNNLDAEVKLILGYRTGRWVFAANPEIGFKVSGNGSGAQPDLSNKIKIAYRTGEDYSIGIEHYSELGQLRHIGPLNQQSQQTFAVVDFKRKGKDFNIGIGRGWNDFSERWVIKTIVSFPFGGK